MRFLEEWETKHPHSVKQLDILTAKKLTSIGVHDRRDTFWDYMKTVYQTGKMKARVADEWLTEDEREDKKVAVLAVKQNWPHLFDPVIENLWKLGMVHGIQEDHDGT